MMKIHRYLRNRVRQQLERNKLLKIYSKFRDFTMIDSETYMNNLRLSKHVRDIPGCVIECGVWRGGMIAGISQIIGTNRQYFLCDSFEGLPHAKEIDGEAALRYQNDPHYPNYRSHNNCTAPPDFSRQAMTLAGVDRFQLVKGWFHDTLPQLQLQEPIALLRLDADWYESTMVCLETFYNQLAPNGLIILDDYYTWDGCSRALHDFLSKRKALERVQSFEEICFLTKTVPASSSTGTRP